MGWVYQHIMTLLDVSKHDGITSTICRCEVTFVIMILDQGKGFVGWVGD